MTFIKNHRSMWPEVWWMPSHILIPYKRKAGDRHKRIPSFIQLDEYHQKFLLPYTRKDNECHHKVPCFSDVLENNVSSFRVKNCATLVASKKRAPGWQTQTRMTSIWHRGSEGQRLRIHCLWGAQWENLRSLEGELLIYCTHWRGNPVLLFSMILFRTLAKPR